jgi:hypothetical protein
MLKTNNLTLRAIDKMLFERKIIFSVGTCKIIHFDVEKFHKSEKVENISKSKFSDSA